MLKVYLAARYSRRLELAECKRAIEATPGLLVTSSWLDGSHQIDERGLPVDEAGEREVEGDDGSDSEAARRLRQKFAIDDLNDVSCCDLLIAFTEPPKSGHSRGGRHVELGIALGMGKRVWVIGHRENVFCWLPQVSFFPKFEDALMCLKVTAGVHWSEAMTVGGRV